MKLILEVIKFPFILTLGWLKYFYYSIYRRMRISIYGGYWVEVDISRLTDPPKDIKLIQTICKLYKSEEKVNLLFPGCCKIHCKKV